MNRTVIYAGSFDPPTNGHLDLIHRASKIFEHVVVAVLQNTEKQSLLEFTERADLLRQVTAEIPNVEVDVFHGLLVDYVHRRDARHILRGIRALSDFEYEFQIALMNRRLAPDIETVFLMPREEYTYLSSRMVREVARFGGPLGEFVPAPVAELLRKRFPSQG